METTRLHLIKNKLSLEQEKENFIRIMSEFIDPIDLGLNNKHGRPSSNLRDILKSLLMMSYHSMSYRRTQSDLKFMHTNNLIGYIPPRSTLNDYANKPRVKSLIERLIQLSAIFFIAGEDTAIIDSTTFAFKVYKNNPKLPLSTDKPTLSKVRKLNVLCFRDSKIVGCAITSSGLSHDINYFKDLINAVQRNGFSLKVVLADAAYSSKEIFAFCKDKKIKDVYINFKSNSTLKRPKSDLWKEQLTLYKDNKEIWKETYRFRGIIEGVFSAIKKKNLNYLRSKKEVARDVEMLLKILVYNITIMGKYSDTKDYSD